jgi:hypothetical protein
MMVVAKITFLLLFLSGFIPSAKADEPACLVRDGRALGRIYLPDKLRPATVFAVKELQDHLERMTGASLEIAWRKRLQNEKGFELRVRAPAEWQGELSAQGFSIRQSASPPVVSIVGNTHLAVLYGVYAYLDSLGVRWYTPGDIGTRLPRLDAVTIEPGETISEPVCILRSLDVSGTEKTHFSPVDDERREKMLHEYTLWTLRNRLHFRRRIHRERNNRFGFNRPPYGGGHALRRIAGLDRLFSDQQSASFEANPERWPMLTRNFEKQRTNQGAHQICFTNEDNIREAIANTIRRHQEFEAEENDLQEVAAVSLALADCSGICECETCRKIAGDGPHSQDRLVWWFMNRVARGVNERLPGRKILLYAPYYELTQPPPDVTLEPNIIAVSCRSYSWNKASGQAVDDPFPPRYREWIARTGEAGAEQAVYDYVLMTAAPQPLDILDAFEEYQALGYRYYQPEVMQRSEQTWPILWALAQASWGSEQSPRELFATFCREYYGEANGALVRELLETITANSRKIRRICYGSAMNSSVMLPESLVASMRRRLRHAIRTAPPGKPAERIRRFNNSMEVHFRMGELFRIYADALNYRTPETIGTVRDLAADFLRFWNENQVGQIFSCNATGMPERILKKNFADIQPTARADYAERDILLKTIFDDEVVPDTLSNLFVLPEIWRLKLDPRGLGVSQNWQAVDLADAPEDGWQEVSTWNFIERQGYGPNRLIDGDFWVRLTFKAPEFTPGRRVYLRFGALDDEGSVFINGREVVERRSIDGHQWNRPFEVEVTETLRSGADNLLVVHGYDAEGAGGIWRPVVLYTR